MNTYISFSMSDGIPVTIGELTIWTEEFKASAVKMIKEETMIDGSEAVTNASPRALKIVFKGRVVNEKKSLAFILNANEQLRSAEQFDVTYRGLTFNNCYIQAFTFEDTSEEYIRVSLTLITASSVSTPPNVLNGG